MWRDLYLIPKFLNKITENENNDVEYGVVGS